VEQLADRPEGRKPATAPPYRNLIPLRDILAEIYQVGSKTQKVIQSYRAAIETLGPEFTILDQLEFHEIEKAGIPLLSEAIQRMRTGKIEIRPGYDGEYGTIQIFSSLERSQIGGQRSLFAMPGEKKTLKPRNHPAPLPKQLTTSNPVIEPSENPAVKNGAILNADQQKSGPS
jgi:DNA helicase-2/ATP-dependent DNA helicase PcrA